MHSDFSQIPEYVQSVSLKSPFITFLDKLAVSRATQKSNVAKGRNILKSHIFHLLIKKKFSHCSGKVIFHHSHHICTC